MWIVWHLEAFLLSFNVAWHHIKDNKDLINYGLMTNLMRRTTDQYLKMWLKTMGVGGGHAPPELFGSFHLQMVHSESI